MDDIERKLIQKINTNQELADDYLELVAEDKLLLEAYKKNK